MINEIKFVEKVESDCKTLEAEINKFQDMIKDLSEIYGKYFNDFMVQYMDKNLPVVSNYDHRYKVSPSKAQFLKEKLKYIFNLLEAWGFYELPKSSNEQEKNSLTVGDLLESIESMTLQERKEHFEDNPAHTEIWLVNKLEQRRMKELEYKEQQKEEAIGKYRRKQDKEAEKLSKSKEAEECLRDTLQKWVQQKQTSSNT
jgi:hypothetical protein